VVDRDQGARSASLSRNDVALLPSRALTLAEPRLQREPLLKRPLDVTLAVIGLVLSAPLWVLVALAIVARRDGSVLYRQRRWGRVGAPFILYKFRTMIATSEEAHEVTQAVVDDERVTPLGRILRATGIDELPQFFNILKGDMSFVGPRALAFDETLNIEGTRFTYDQSPVFLERQAVRPGLTGLATIYLPKDAPPGTKFQKDLEYINTQAFWLDVKLIFLSLWISIRGKWESREKKL
jgi:lipopolysaccharide/colanic/teichoic acid biosynthesis glycosyltransferase